MEPLTPISSPSRNSLRYSGDAPAIPSLDLSTTQDLLSSMKTEAATLSSIFGSLEIQTNLLAKFGENETAQEIAKTREYMREQDQMHAGALAEIQLALDNLLENGFLEHLEKQAYQQIEEEIDELVREQVALCLKDHTSQELQDEIVQNKEQLEVLQVQLHNSESRRANGSINFDQSNDALRTILMSNGKVSSHFPKDIEDLANIDGETCKNLMLDYELHDISEIKNRNLSRFMLFCGVVNYQLVERN